MKLSVELVQAAVDNANKCLYSIYPNYVEPRFINIKFTKAKSYWAMISQSTSKPIGKYKDFNIRIGSLFELIPNDDLCIIRLEECMIHELIHTIPGCNNHGYKFKQIANRVNRKYCKYKIEVQTSGDRFGISAPEPQINYEIICKHCGARFYRSRRLKKPLSDYMCSICSSDNLEIKKI